MLAKIATLFHQGGYLVMSTISLVLLFSLVIVIERCYRYWIVYDLSNSVGFISAIQKMIMNNSIENAIRLCIKPKTYPLITISLILPL